MQLGTAIHAEIERFLNGAPWGAGGSVELDAGYRRVVELARAAEPALLPLRQLRQMGLADVEVDEEIPAGVIGPLPTVARIDFRCKAARQVIDHKTLADPNAPWVKSPQDLARDPQLLLYAGASLPPGDPVWLAHLRICTKVPGAWLVEANPTENPLSRAPVPWDFVAEALQHATEVSGRMYALVDHRDEGRVSEVPYSRGGCKKYGGCPYRARCPDSPQNRPSIDQHAGLMGLFTAPNNDPLMSMFTEPDPGKEPTVGMFDRKVNPQTTDATNTPPAGVPSTSNPPPGVVAGQVHPIVPPDARPDDDPAMVRALAVVRLYHASSKSVDLADLAAKSGVEVGALEARVAQMLAGQAVTTSGAAPDVKAQQVEQDATALRLILGALGPGEHKSDDVKRSFREAVGLAAVPSARWMAVQARLAQAGEIDYSASTIIVPSNAGARPSPGEAIRNLNIGGVATSTAPQGQASFGGPSKATETPPITNMVQAGTSQPLRIITRPVLVVGAGVSVGSTPLRSAVAAFIQAVEAKLGKPYDLTDFNEGAKLVGAALRNALKADPTLGVVGFVDANPADPLTTYAEIELREAGWPVVRGWR